MRQLCISSFQDWTRTALNWSIQGLIDHVGIGNVSTEHLLEQLKATLHLSQSVATAWSDGATLDCTIAYKIMLCQWDQALWGVSSLVSQDEWEFLRTAPFVASSLFDDIPNKLQLWDKVARRQRDNVLYRGSTPFAIGKRVLLHKRSAPTTSVPWRHASMSLSSSRTHLFLASGDVVQDVTLTNLEDDDTGHDYLCPRTRAPVSPTVARPLTLFVYKKGWSSVVPVLWCLETKEMQQFDLRCSGSRFPSSVPSTPHDGWLICFCRQGLYHEAHSHPIFDTVHATNYVVEVVRDTATPGCYCHLFLVPKKSGGWRPLIDLSFLNLFQVTPTPTSII